MNLELYTRHLSLRRAKAEAALAETGFDELVLDSGASFRYFADDQDAPHHPGPHFAHWVPLAGPHHLLRVRAGARPRLVRFAPEDYWYEQLPVGSPFWLEAFDYAEAGEADKVWQELGARGRAAYVGDSPQTARARGIAEEGLNPPELVARLDWDRSYKTAYEVACIEEAARKAARGHRAARAAFEAGESELEIHHAYVAAVGCLDHELPYPSIVALAEKGATLHYEKKRGARAGKVLLIDSGATHEGYASDITRTWTAAGTDPLFRELVLGLDQLQQELCAAVRPGLAYPELHLRSHLAIGDLLHELGLIRTGGEEALERGLTRPFFPHGLGHFLGLQVHDVAGRQASREGGTLPPPDGHPYLRTTRTIEPDMVFTIEPGIYFIEMLLREHRAGERRRLFEWPLVDRLSACGGARIEDDVLVTAAGHRNLTRPHI